MHRFLGAWLSALPLSSIHSGSFGKYGDPAGHRGADGTSLRLRRSPPLNLFSSLSDPIHGFELDCHFSKSLGFALTPPRPSVTLERGHGQMRLEPGERKGQDDVDNLV